LAADTVALIEEGRISYEKGIADALSVFKEAQATSDPQTIILAEYTLLPVLPIEQGSKIYSAPLV
jgi:hypothetical protein